MKNLDGLINRIRFIHASRDRYFCINSPIQFELTSKFVVGPIAQSVEQRTFNPWVDGSSPSGPTRTKLITKSVGRGGVNHA